MGQGNKFDSDLSTIGGRTGFVTNKEVLGNDSLAAQFLNEMTNEAIKYTKEKIIFIVKLKNGNKIFLEENGLKHIIERHGKQFEDAFGIKKNQIAKLLGDTISKGNLVSSNVKIINGKTCYSNKYYYKGEYCIIYGIADNGYIETAYARKVGK